MRKPTAKSLILDLLLASNGRPLSARQAIAACDIFGISINNTRVALVRLCAEGLIESPGRAMYHLTENAHTLADDVAAWRTKSQRVRPWDGSYIAIQTEKLPRTETRHLKERERALLMLGFRPLNTHLYLRPNNIEDNVGTVRGRLYKLGLEKNAPVFCASDFDDHTHEDISRLWDIETLEANYAAMNQKIDHWLEHHHTLAQQEAARESFLLGSNAIKHVVFDPFLPTEWVSKQARDSFLATVQKLDVVGQGVWKKLWESLQVEVVEYNIAF